MSSFDLSLNPSPSPGEGCADLFLSPRLPDGQAGDGERPGERSRINIFARPETRTNLWPINRRINSPATFLDVFLTLLTTAGPIETIFGSRTSTDFMRLPKIVFSKPLRRVSTSGSSGILLIYQLSFQIYKCLQIT